MDTEFLVFLEDRNQVIYAVIRWVEEDMIIVIRREFVSKGLVY